MSLIIYLDIYRSLSSSLFLYIHLLLYFFYIHLILQKLILFSIFMYFKKIKLENNINFFIKKWYSSSSVALNSKKIMRLIWEHKMRLCEQSTNVKEVQNSFRIHRFFCWKNYIQCKLKILVIIFKNYPYFDCVIFSDVIFSWGNI